MGLTPADYIKITKDALELVRTQQEEAAYERIKQALLESQERCFNVRQKAVAAVNRNLRETKDQKAKFLQAIDTLPEQDRDYARLRLRDLVEKLFNSEIVKLRAIKRQHSKPQ